MPAAALDVPGVRFLDAGDGRARLEVGGTAHAPPATPDEVCLAWTWDEPSPEIELYPGGEAGVFAAVETTWSLSADGTAVSPPRCPRASPFPELGLGPADELWFLRRENEPAAASSWADLLHVVEAAYRQSAPRGGPPLAVSTVGTYGRCRIHSTPVDLETRFDRWLPVELPRPPGLVRVRRFVWWVEPAPGDPGCVKGRTGTLRLFPLPGGEPASGDRRHLVTVAGVGSRSVSHLDLDPRDRSPRVRVLAPVEAEPAAVAEPPAEPRDRETYLAPTLAVAAAVLSLAAFLRARPRWPRAELVRLIETTAGSRRVRALLDDATRRLDERAAELRSDLEAHARALLTPPASSGKALQPGPEPPPPEAGPSALPSASSGPGEGRLADGLEAMSELGLWIELLWPVLREASGSELDAISDGLPDPAAKEWRSAREILEEFSRTDAAAARQALRRPPSGNGRETSVADVSRLLDRNHLEPFDHPGRLGRVTLALQYLLEAYPVEQLEPGRRSLLRRGVARAAGSVPLPEDFHGLIARIAAGAGLDYRAVAYYKSRLDQREFAFVRGQVSPISLTERVGFAAATDPVVIVRLARPFFFQSANHVYYAGHAHVARG